MGSSCWLVGLGALPAQCGEVLLRRGHRVCGVLSQDPRLERWAGRQGVRFLSLAGDDAAALGEAPFDYLFSIVNPAVLPAGVLRLPRRMAINYHDSLLPAYAGTHSTSWALLAGEETHGITWHVMAERVDSGGILKQRRFPVVPGETAFTLNMKCYEAALQSFEELLEDLELGRIEPQPQDLGRRSYHRRSERPAAAGVFSWQRPAEELDRLVRSLDYGSTPNPLVCPKISLSGGAFGIVRRIEVLGTSSGGPPGTLTGLAGTSVKVSTVTREIALREVATIDGGPLGTADLLTGFRLYKGYRFPEPDPETAERITRLSSSLAQHEPAWGGSLARLQPAPAPARPEGSAPVWEEVPLPDQVWSPADRGAGAVDLLVAALSVWLSCRTGLETFDIGFQSGELAGEVRGLEGLFAAHVPVRVDLQGAGTLADVLERVRGELARVRRHGTYARDLVARMPQLRDRELLRRQPRLEVLVEEGEPREETAPPGLVLAVDNDARRCRWTAVPGELGSLRSLVEELVADSGRPRPVPPAPGFRSAGWP